MKKSITTLLAALFCLNLFAQTKPSKGDGSAASPYKISNAQELLWFAQKVNGKLAGEKQDLTLCGELTADIDLSEVCGEAIGNWDPIGFARNNYGGTFEGNGYGIKNLYLSETSSSIIGRGFFGVTDHATITNLSILSGFINTKNVNIGAIAGNAYQSAIINCHNYIPVTGGKFTGGIVGYTNGSSISKCHNEGEIKLTSDHGCGGICGGTYGAKVSYCYNVGNIIGKNRAGAIVGSHENGASLTNSFAYNSDVSLIGENSSSTSSNCYLNDAKNSSSSSTKTKEQFASGEVCYLLNENSENPIFFQSIGVNEYPVLNSVDVVFKDEEGYYNESQFACEHKDTITVAPTCTSSGYVCCSKCHKKFDMIPQTRHDTTITVVKTADCKSIGYSSAKCSKCDLFLYYCDTIPALEHDTVQHSVEATCKSIGYKYRKCSLCKVLLGRSDTVPALGHDSVFSHHQEATCKSDEYYYYDCSRCSSLLTVKGIPALGHDTVMTTTGPTCGTFGHYEKKCSRCNNLIWSGKLLSSQPTMEHTYVDDFCTVCGLARSVKPDSVDGYFLIKDARELLWFSEAANARRKDTLNAKLVADIDLSSVCGAEMKKNWFPIKNNYGIFDGQHHTVSNLYFDKDNESNDIAYLDSYNNENKYIGLFSCNKMTVKNINVKDVYISANNIIGSIVGCHASSPYNGILYGCSCENAELYQSNYKDITKTGAICGEADGIVSACYANNVKFNDRGASSIVGMSYNKNVTNCFFRNTNTSQICSSYNKTENCYSLIRNDYYGGTYTTKDQCQSGELCYLLNLGLDEPVWVQNLGVDSFPYISKGETDNFVNLVSVTKACQNSNPVSVFVNCKEKDVFVNNDTIITYPIHINVDDDTIRYDCCHYITDEVIASYGDTMQINSVNDFLLFRDIVSSGKRNINGILNVDLDLSSVCGEKIGNWTPIYNFAGKFDGQHHKISGLYINQNGNHPDDWDVDIHSALGLFDGNYGIITRVGIAKNCVLKSDSLCVGTVCAVNYGVVSCCYNEADVESTEGIAGGVVGVDYGVHQNSVVSCYNVGQITGDKAAGIIGCNYCGVVFNCHNYGPIKRSYYVGNDISYMLECDYFVDDYILSDTLCDTIIDRYKGHIKTIYASEISFASGEICYALNKGQDSTVWYQTLNVDPYPVLDPTHGKVLYDEDKNIYYNYPLIISNAENTVNEKTTALVTFVVTRQVIVVGADSFRIIDMFGHDVTSFNGSLADGIYVVVANGNVAKVVVK